jgi:serine/threonine protein kinase
MAPRFSPYEVLLRTDDSPWEIGRGAMGVTYRARDPRSGDDVALKVIHPARLDDALARARFQREARAAARVESPHVARVLQVGESDAGCFYAMEFIDGETLLDLLHRDGALPTAQALDIARQIAVALAAAANEGLVHRDIKPSNIMLARSTPDGGFVAKLIDFGLAKSAAEQPQTGEETTITHAGFVGTPHFASPEQLEEQPLDVRSDIYSLGATLYFMLSGRTPFTGSLAQVMSQHLRANPPREPLAGQPREVVALVERLMHKDPAARPANAILLQREIEACLSSVTAARNGAPGGAPAESGDDGTITDELPTAPETPVPAVGVTLAGRFELLEEYPLGEFGRTFRARNLETGGIVAVLLLDPRLLPTSEAYTRLENEVTALQAVTHPAVLRVHSIEWMPPVSWISREWVEGPSLLDAMRRAGGLALDEALEILRALAGGLDAVQRAGVPCPELAAQWIALLPNPAGGAPLPKFNALNLSHVAPAPRGEAPFQRRSGGGYVCALAALAYEMLGGSLAGRSDRAFVPVRGLPADANAVLRRALHPGHEYRTPGALIAALADGLGV